MTLKDLITNTKRHLNDINSGIFSEDDIKAFINESIDRIRMHPYFRDMEWLTLSADAPVILPVYAHGLLALYAASRCFFQDERFYEATNFMNDFEYKLEDLVQRVESGDIILKDANGDDIDLDSLYELDYVEDIYFSPNYNIDDEEV
jgi:hypothetical protein